MKISVAMSTYNGARYLREQLDSIAAQTRLPDELVICDDGSTDGTREIISEFATTAPFPVKVHLNKQNLGSTKNFESAIGLCSGDLIALSDQDDTWLPEKLAQLEAGFASAANVGLIFTDAEVINDDGLPTGYTVWERLPFKTDERLQIQSRRAIDLLLAGSTVTGATMAFRGRFKDLILPIPTDLPIIHDAWIAILIAAVSGVLPLASPLVRYRQHSEQQVGARKRKSDKGGVAKAMRRVTSFQELIDIGTAVQERLTQHYDAYESGYASSRLKARLSHLQSRAQLPERALPRVKLVFTELFAGRYHAYSRGLLSAAKDLLHGFAQ